jgi:ABC-type glycerol-3-phosphate transport system substrate-binding protein
MKKILCLCLCLALTLVMSATALADITIVGASTNTSDDATKMMDGWKTEFPFAIQYENEPGYSDTVNKLTTMLASGDDSVDVMWIDEIMQLAFTRAGFLEPLDDVVSADDTKAFLPDYVDKFMKYNDKTYSVPANLSVIGMFVNQQMLKEKGLKVPTNEQELIDTAKALTDPSKNQYGIVLSLDKASHLQDNLNLFCQMFGGNYYDFSQEGTQKAVKFLYDLINTYGVVSKDCLSYDNNAEQQAFLDGHAAMCFEWAFINAIEDAGKFGPDQITWAPMPTFKTNAAPYSCWMWVVNANSKHKDEAKQFVKAQLDAQHQIQYQAATWGGMPANTTAWTDATLKAKLPNMLDMCTSYMNAGSFVARTLSTRHSEYMDVVTGTLQRYLLNEISFDECIKTCISQTTEILANAAK